MEIDILTMTVVKHYSFTLPIGPRLLVGGPLGPSGDLGRLFAPRQAMTSTRYSTLLGIFSLLVPYSEILLLG